MASSVAKKVDVHERGAYALARTLRLNAPHLRHMPMFIAMPAQSPVEWLADFRVDLSTSRSVTTIDEYYRDVQRFLSKSSVDVERPDALRAVLPISIQAWMDLEREQGAAVSSLYRRFCSVRMFLRFVAKAGGVEAWVIEEVEPPPYAQRDIRVVSVDSVQAMLASAGDGTMEIRNRALLFAMYEGAGTASEVLSLQMRDIHVPRLLFIGGIATVRRHLVLSNPAASAMEEWKEVRTEPSNTSAQLAFPSASGRALDRHRLFRLVRERGETCEVRGEVTPRVLRNSRGAHLTMTGLSQPDVREKMGLSSTAMDSSYRDAALRLSAGRS